MPIVGETILITGASSGIGRALAKSLATKNTVIACGRNIEALSSLAKEVKNISPLAMDVSVEDDIEANKVKLNALCDKLDRVVLNAGDCLYLQPESIDWSIFKKMMDVNFFGWINTLQICFEHLENSPNPHIVGISSQVVHAPFSQAEAYGASKAAARYLLNSLSLDIKWRGFDTSLIYPGFVDTPLTQKNVFPMPFLMSSEKAAQEIMFAMEKRLREYSFPKKLRTLLWISNLLPNYWFNKMQYKKGSI